MIWNRKKRESIAETEAKAREKNEREAAWAKLKRDDPADYCFQRAEWAMLTPQHHGYLLEAIYHRLTNIEKLLREDGE